MLSLERPCFRDQSSRYGGEWIAFPEESFRLPVALLKTHLLIKYLNFFLHSCLLLFLAPLQDLKNITPEDFSIGVDYTSLNAQENRATPVFQAPERVQNLRWEPKTGGIFNSSIACQKSLDLPEELAVGNHG